MMWIAKFIACTMIEGCMAVTFEDQTEFVTKFDCEVYAEEKADLFAKTMSAHGLFGKIYYGCEQEDGIKT